MKMKALFILLICGIMIGYVPVLYAEDGDEPSPDIEGPVQDPTLLPTPTPWPTRVTTPVPTETDGPIPTDIPTPVPTPTDGPIPTDTPTPVPTPTDGPIPTDTPTPTPTTSPEPTRTTGPIGGNAGWYEFLSSPSGADVILDSVYRGDTPLVVRVSSTGTPGHSVIIHKEGYADWSSQLPGNPASGQTIQVTASLQPLAQYGMIRVSSEPPGSVAILDGTDHKTTPCTFPSVLYGEHTIQVMAAGYSPYSAPVRLSSATSVVNARLTPVSSPGILQVSSDPAGADIILDGVMHGQTPLTIRAVAPGTHDISLRHAGYQTWTGKASVKAGEVTTISQTLTTSRAELGSATVSSVPAGASVYFNGSYLGKTPDTGSLDIPDLNPGPYRIALTQTGYQDYAENVTITAGEVTPIMATLKPADEPGVSNGTLDISSSPSGVEVYLDNLFRGITPVTIPDVTPVSHDLLLMTDGRSPDILTEAGQSSSRVNIAAQAGSLIFVNGSYAGVVPDTGVLMIPGNIPSGTSLLVSSAGYEDYLTGIEVNASTNELPITLIPGADPVQISRTLYIRSSPAGAGVVADNSPVGSTPATLTTRAGGNHRIMIIMPDNPGTVMAAA